MSYCKVTDIPESTCGLELYEDNAGRYHIFCTDDEDEVMDDFRWCRTADMARSGQVKLIATVYFGTDYLTCYSGIWASMLNSYFGMDFYALH